MSQKEEILALLQNGQALTQTQVAEAVYGDRKHTPHVYSALQSLVKEGVVIRKGAKPALYSLSDVSSTVPISAPAVKGKKQPRDVSHDVISNETLDKASKIV